MFPEAFKYECVYGSWSLWLPTAGGGYTASEDKPRAMPLSRFNELVEYRWVPWTILTHCIALVWCPLSQGNGGSGRLRTGCPSVPVVVGVEVLVLWAPKPPGPLSPVLPWPPGLYWPAGSGWELQSPAVPLPSLWAYGRTCRPCSRL